MKHRGDIDGLRAVAIAPVVAFHAGLPFASGGFVGVDIFFVISGFLITGIVAREIEAGTFSLWSFYERRVRRLLPALTVVLLASTIAALFVLMPSTLVKFGKALEATALFFANVHFSHTDYFTSEDVGSPLLHMWSLGVEEQFYLLLPITLIVLFRYGLNARLWFAVAAIISFAASAWGVYNAPLEAFYLLHFRAWELLVGGALALGLVPAVRSQPGAEILGGLGIALIAGSIILLDSETPFPGAAALAPCVGAALIIHSGTVHTTFFSRALSLRLPVFIGLISYPLYLWHWPILIFAKEHLQRELASSEVILAVAAALTASALTWRYVETPIRSRRVFAGRREVFAAGFSIASVAVLGNQIFLATSGLPARLPADVASIAAGFDDKSPKRDGCYRTDFEQLERGEPCVVGDLNAVDMSFAILGDSHATAMASVVETLAMKAGKKGVVITRNGCSPTSAMLKKQDPSRCETFMNLAMDYLQRNSGITTIVVIVRWSYYPALDQDLSRVLAALDGRRIFLTLPIPEYYLEIPTVAARAVMAGRSPPTMSRGDFEKQKGALFPLLSDIAGRAGAQALKPSAVFCNEIECLTVKDGRSLYYDENHPSLFANMLLEPVFEPVFANQPGTIGRLQ